MTQEERGDLKPVCKKCNLRLQTITAPDGKVSYFHAGARDVGAAGRHRVDHEPEPVLRPAASATLMCDFCSAENPGWKISLTEKVRWADTPTEYGTAETRDDGVWAACDTCKDLVDNRKVRLLHERSVKSMSALTGERVEPAAAEGMRLRQQEFWSGKPGKAVPMAPRAPKLRMHPRDVPVIRDEVVGFYRRYEKQAVSKWLESADLYLVRASQVKYASAMAAPLTSHEGLLGYAPAAAGFMCLEESPNAPSLVLDGYQLAVRAYAWQVHGDRTETIAWAATADVPPEWLGDRERARLTPLIHGGYNETTAEARVLYDRRQFEGDPKMFHALFTLWYRMTEPRYSSSSVDKPAPRDKRKAARKGADPRSMDVTVIDVRHPRQPTGKPGGQGREAGWTMDYREDVKSHSKLVRWGTGRKYTRRVWVDGYERGPENAPKKGEKPVVKVVK